MKRTNAFAIFAAVLSLSAMSLSFSSPVQKLRGTVRFYGSSPFIYPGFETEDGKKYTLEVPSLNDFTLDELSSHEGELIELTGKKKGKRLAPHSLPDGHIVVESYEVVSPLDKDAEVGQTAGDAD
ncbi:MAG: hypothetical protein II837_10120 [Treponema sp.]|nr:hypothetical protein [Treponema sp.]MBQ6566179.1 hypothetical protein [Treponema sp.]MBQ7167496.1 hypothetical protein [Treponema sp.]